jgi:TetR/AcrR family transcriptional regulator, tetracycline repressor protein
MAQVKLMSTSTNRNPVRRSRGGTQPLPLTRDDIVSAALPLLARDGVDGLTMRSVADALGISSPAVYHYFSSRDDLIDRLCERVAAEVDLTVDPLRRWDDAVVVVLLNMDRTFARYRGVASRVLATRRRSPAAERISETVRALILDGGFEPDDADDLLASLQFLFGGWLLRRPVVDDESADPALLERSIRWMLDGCAA